MQKIIGPVAMGSSLKALGKDVNEDYFFIDPDHRFMIIADGMGGHYGGSIASKTAGQALADYLDNEYMNKHTNTSLLEAGFRNAHEKVLRAKENDDRLREMGATLLALLIRPSKHKPRCTLACIGDSRLYCLHDGRLEQKTKDDTLIQRAIDVGQISRSDAVKHPLRHILTQCVGQRGSHPTPFVTDINIELGDVVIMCTDGVYEAWESKREYPPLETTRDTGSDPQAAVCSILNQILNIQAGDDATAIVIGFRGTTDQTVRC